MLNYHLEIMFVIKNKSLFMNDSPKDHLQINRHINVHIIFFLSYNITINEKYCCYEKCCCYSYSIRKQELTQDAASGLSVPFVPYFPSTGLVEG